MDKPAKLQRVNITVKTVPHPDPQRAIDLIARLVIKNCLEELEAAAKGA
jgi:hypothetical protein